jgi:hypothetical protein
MHWHVCLTDPSLNWACHTHSTILSTKLCLELSYSFHTHAHHNFHKYYSEKKTHVDLDSLLNLTVSVHEIKTVHFLML